MTTLYLIRHGETDWNRVGRIQGQSDTPLNDTGREQARLLGERLNDVPFDLAFASDLSRAVETAELILGARGLLVQTDAGLRERAFGRWEGLDAAEAFDADPELWEAWRNRVREVSPPGGESQIDLERRVTGAVESIITRHEDRTLLIVSHGGAIQATLWVWFRLDVRGLANCGGFVIRIEAGERKIVERL